MIKVVYKLYKEVSSIHRKVSHKNDRLILIKVCDKPSDICACSHAYTENTREGGETDRRFYE